MLSSLLYALKNKKSRITSLHKTPGRYGLTNNTKIACHIFEKKFILRTPEHFFYAKLSLCLGGSLGKVQRKRGR